LVQHAKLNARLVNRPAHKAIERINLPNQLPLCKAANRRIARHFTNRIKAMGDKQGRGTHARRSRSRLRTCVPTAND
jgi:hypothetical protein